MHIVSVNHGQSIHHQCFHLLLAPGIRIPDVWGDGMVNTANLLPVGNLAGINLPNLALRTVNPATSLNGVNR